MKLIIKFKLILAMTAISSLVYGQQSLENLDVLTERFEYLAENQAGDPSLAAFVETAPLEGKVKYSLSPLYIDADGTSLAGASFSASKNK
ncbi:MAG: hypothetical protein AAF197_10765, partial [Pseudomonadota bacterium]